MNEAKVGDRFRNVRTGETVKVKAIEAVDIVVLNSNGEREKIDAADFVAAYKKAA